jgi:hypothetical protein
VAGLGRNAHSQQILLLWEVHGLQRTCKVHCNPDVVEKTEVDSMLAESAQCCSEQCLALQAVGLISLLIS